MRYFLIFKPNETDAVQCDRLAFSNGWCYFELEERIAYALGPSFDGTFTEVDEETYLFGLVKDTDES